MWVLRCAKSGEPFASQKEVPDMPDMPVIINLDIECYWALESVIETESVECPICDAIGGHCGSGSCPPRA